MMSRPLHRSVFFLAALAGAWGLGFYMGDSSRPVQPSAGAATANSHASLPRPTRSMLSTDRGLAGPQEESNALRAQQWSPQRLQDAARSVLREGSIVRMVQRAVSITAQLELEDLPAAVAAAQTMKGDGNDAIIFSAMTLARWAELDPASAVAYVQKNPQFDFDTVETEAVWSSWASVDPTAAIAKAREFPESERKSAISAIIETLARRDPAQAKAFAEVHAPEWLKDGALETAISSGTQRQPGEVAARQLAAVNQSQGLHESVRRWAAKDRATALTWARELKDPEMRKEALRGAYGEWFTAKPVEAAAALLAEERDPQFLEPLANIALSHWPVSDEAGALAWAAQLPKGLNLADGYGYLAERAGGGKSPEAGARWIDQLPPGATRDEAVARYTIQVVDEHGAAAMEWANTIGDPEKRRDTIRRLTKSWFSRDPAAAFQWLQSDPLLSPEDKQAILAK